MKIRKFTYMMLILGVFALVMHTAGCVDDPEYPGDPIFADTDLIDITSTAGPIEWKDPGDDINIVIFIFNTGASTDILADNATKTFTDATYNLIVSGTYWADSDLQEGRMEIAKLKDAIGTPPNVTFDLGNPVALNGGNFIVIVGFSNGIITHSSPVKPI